RTWAVFSGRLADFGVARELEQREPDAADQHLIGPDPDGRHEVRRHARGRHEVVLLDTVAADPETADDYATARERQAAGEEHDPTLVGHVVGIEPLRAGVGHVAHEVAKERSRRRVVDTGWKQRHRAEPDGPRRHRGALRHALKVERVAPWPAEVDRV